MVRNLACFPAAYPCVLNLVHRSAPILLAALLAIGANAQPCSIDIGPDAYRCQGQTATFTGPAGYASWLWSTGATTQSITTGIANTYWCQVSYPSGNLVTNGNFSAGATGFSTQWNYNLNLQGEGTYVVGNNAGFHHPQFAGTGTGNFLIVNAGWGAYSAGMNDVWCQTVNVCPGQTYTLSYRGRSVSSSNPARLQWWVDGAAVGPEVTLPAQAAGWTTVNTSWTSGAVQTSANVCIRVMSGDGVGNDFGLDDISVNGTIVLRDYVDLILWALPVMNCAGPYGPRCINGAPVALNGTPAGGTWSGNGVAGSTFTPSTAGLGAHVLTYSYTDGNGCPNSCTTSITVNPLPLVNCGLYAPRCVSAAPFALGGAPFGGTWSGPGVAANMFSPGVAGVGNHAVTYTYTNANGCTSSCSTNITVHPLPAPVCGSYGPVCVSAPAFALVGAPAGGTWSGPGVAGNNFNPGVAGAGSHAVTYSYTDGNGCTGTCSTSITVNALPVLNCGSVGPTCANDAPIALGGTPAGGSWSGPGVSANAFDPSAVGAGNHPVSYSSTDANGCSNSCVTFVTVHPVPVLACGNYGPVCVNAPPVALAGAPAGGTWIGNGVVGNAFDPSIAGTGSHTLAYTYTDANGCTGSCTTDILVNHLPAPSCGNYGPLCVDASPIALNGNPAGGTWSGAGVVGNNFDPAAAGVGPHAITYTYTDANGCTNSCTTNITVEPLPVLVCGSYGPFCLTAAPWPLGGVPLGGTWSGVGISANTFDPAAAGVGNHVATYSYTDGNGCVNTCTSNIQVNSLPVVACGNYGPVCMSGAAVALGGIPAGGTWSGSGVAGNAFSPGSAGTGTHTLTYSFTDVNGCTSTCTTDITVHPLPVVNCGSYGPACVNAAPIVLNGSPAGGTWSGTGVTGGSFNPATAGVGIHAVTYSYADGNGCTNTCSTNISVNGLPAVDAGTYAGGCSQDAPIALAGSPSGGGWSGPGVSGALFDPVVAGPGTHTLSYTYSDANGCTNVDDANVIIAPAPLVDIGPDTTVCEGTAVTFDAFVLGATYLWSSGTTGTSLSVITPGTVWVEVTLNGCTTYSSAELSNVDQQTVNLGANVTVCAGTPVPLDATVPGATYLWSTNATSNTINATSTGWHWVDVSLDGCTVRDSVYVTINPIPQVNLGLDRMVCPGATALLDATAANASYLWSNNATTPTVQATPGPWWVQVTVNGCTGTDNVNVGTFTPPTVDLGPDTLLCPGATLLLDATTPMVSYDWQDAAISATYLVQQAGTYSVTVTDNHQCTATDAVIVGYATPNPVFIGQDTTICQGTTLILNATTIGADMYSWNNGWSSPTLPVAGDGLYWVDVVQDDCVVTDSIHVDMAPLPAVGLGNDTTLCPGATLLLTAEAWGDSYLWQNGTTGGTYTVTDDGTFHVAVTDANHCTGHDTINVAYADPDAIDLGPDTTICDGTTLTLDATLPGSTYLWNTMAPTATISVDEIGTYSVQVFQSGCIVADTIEVDVAPSPSVDLGNDTTLCDGATLTLAAAYPGATYAWSTNETTSSIIVGSAATYSVEVDLNGCAVTDMITVEYVPPLSLDLGNDTTLCPGSDLSLSASWPGGTTVWSTGHVGPTITVDDADDYWATIVVSGCTVTDSIAVGYVPLDQLDLGLDPTICDDSSVTFDITYAGATYLWDDGSTDPVRNIDEAGSYWAHIFLGGCMTADTVDLSVTALPSVDLGPDTGLCAGNTLLLDASVPGGSYLWSTGATSAQLTTGPAPITVTVTANGCSVTSAITVAALATPVLDVPADTTLCTDEVWMIDVAQPGATYVWQDGATTSGYLVNTAGAYSVTATIGTCTAFAGTNVTYFDDSVVDLGPDTTLCPGESVLLNLNIPGAVITWPDASHGNTYLVTSGGQQTVLVNAGGCQASDVITVSYTPLPIPDLGSDRWYCAGDSAWLTVSPGAASIAWENGSANDSLQITTSGFYSIELELDGCVSSDAVFVEFFPVIDSLDLGVDRTICLGQEVVIDASTHRAYYDWNTGSDVEAITVFRPGTYIVNISGPCIHATDTVVVMEGDCAPDLYVPNTFTPDGDGINEVFQPVATGEFLDYQLIIFNRWGENIFTSQDLSMGWDGTLNGEPVQDGVYVWRIAYRAINDTGVTQKALTGSITLLR